MDHHRCRPLEHLRAFAGKILFNIKFNQTDIFKDSCIEMRVMEYMNDYFNLVSGWLSVSGNNLLDILPSGSDFSRKVLVEPVNYFTGYVSTVGGSFKLDGESGNWYGSSFEVAIAERPSSGAVVHEHSRLTQDTPVWNLNFLPKEYLEPIFEDRDLASGQYLKSQFISACLHSLDIAGNLSGICFPSRRTEGTVVILNPQRVKLEIIYTGQSPPA